jgi:hypothetical protein
MTLNDAFEGHSLKTTQLIQKSSLLLPAVATCLILAFRPHTGIALGVAMALATVVIPTAYVVARRRVEKARQRETEDILMTHTRTYLRNEEPAVFPVESDIEILARAIDGRKLPMRDFRRFEVIAALPPVADPVVFDALPKRYAIRTACEARFANLAATLPGPVFVPLTGPLIS